MHQAKPYWEFFRYLFVGITELGMRIGYGLLHFNYILMKVVMAAIVFVFNFIGRKLIVMRK